MYTTYNVYGLEGVNITSNWNGCGCAPYRLRVLHEGEVWAPNNIRRRFFDYYPPDDDYIYITKDMSEQMRELTNLCKVHRLLDGDIQWDTYADNIAYREFVDVRALEWLEWLNSIDIYWEKFKATEEYITVRNHISKEIFEYENAIERETKKQKRHVNMGTARIGGRDIPTKIKDDNDMSL